MLYRLTRAIFLPIVLLIMALVILFQMPNENESLVNLSNASLTRKEWNNFQPVVLKINETWNYPDHLKNTDWKNLSCDSWDFAKYHSPLDLRQNPLVLQCLLLNKGKHFGQDFSIKIINTSITQKKFLSDYLPDEAIYLEIEDVKNPSKILGMTLNFDQKLKYLPQANYFYGQDISVLKQNQDVGENYARVIPWDNFGRHFFIDKYPVRNFEITQYLKDSKNLGNIANDPSKLVEAVNTLNAEQQRDYCESIGKKLLEAYVWDGATFYRSLKNYADAATRSSYYFGDRWPNVKECEFQHTVECKLKKFQEADQMSWIGVTDITNNFEHMNNVLDPFYNLKPGSSSLKRTSMWQILGHRLHWSGLNVDPSEFTWNSSILGLPFERPALVKNQGVRFRCMKEWINYP